MSKKNILRIILIVVLVCFFLPFDTVTYINPSAGGKIDTSSNDKISKMFSKDDLVDLEDVWKSRGSKDSEDVGDIRDLGNTGSFSEKAKKSFPRLMIIPAFAAAIAGLVITFIRFKKAVLFSAIAAVAGFVCTIVSAFTIHSWIVTNNSPGEVIIKVNYQVGFYLILAGFVAAAVFGFYASYNKKPVQMPYMGQQYAPPQQESVNHFCYECGFRIGSGDEFCSNCGTKVQ